MVLPIQYGVGIGIVLSLLHGIWTIARAQAVELERIPGTTIWWPSRGETVTGVLVLGFQAPLAFLNADMFVRDVERQITARPGVKLLVIEASSIVEIDYTAAQSVAGLLRHCRERHIDFAVARLEIDPRAARGRPIWSIEAARRGSSVPQRRGCRRDAGASFPSPVTPPRPT